MRRTLVFAAALIIQAVTAHAQSPRVVIFAGNLVDPATGAIQNNMQVTVEKGLITAVEPRGGAAPTDAHVIDMSNAFVLPGLMDTHSHVAIELSKDSVPESTATVTLRAQKVARDIVEAGFTTVRDLGEKNYVVSDLRRAIDAGWTIGPSILNAGKFIGPFGGQSSQGGPPIHELGNTWSDSYANADSPDEMVAAVRQNIFYGAKVLKIIADPKGYFYTEREIRAAADEAHRAGMKLAVHVAGGQAARNAILGGADSLEHGFDLTLDELKLMKEKGTILSTTNFALPQLMIIFNGNEQVARSWDNKIRERLRMAHKLGVKIAYGTDAVWPEPAGRTRGDSMHDMIANYTEAGLSNAETLRAMTITAAELIGVEKDRGVIKRGFRADIIAVSSDPLKDLGTLRKPIIVMAGGKMVVDRRPSH